MKHFQLLSSRTGHYLQLYLLFVLDIERHRPPGASQHVRRHHVFLLD